jgi:hypothetical protein
MEKIKNIILYILLGICLIYWNGLLLVGIILTSIVLFFFWLFGVAGKFLKKVVGDG